MAESENEDNHSELVPDWFLIVWDLSLTANVRSE